MASAKEWPNADTWTVSEYVPIDGVDRRGSITEPRVGELVPGEAQEGGLGRHLGLW